MQNQLGYFDEQELKNKTKKQMLLECQIKLVVEEWLYVSQSAGAQTGQS